MTQAARAARARHRSEIPETDTPSRLETLITMATCIDCCFREPRDSTCRVNGPRARQSGAAGWPTVKATDWCGEWGSV